MEYVELALCRELHCTPSALRAEAAVDISNILTMMGVEAKVRKARGKSRRRR